MSRNVGSVTLSTAFQGKYSEAEPLYKRSETICEKALGSEHPHVATALNNRAELVRAQVRTVRISGSVRRVPLCRSFVLTPCWKASSQQSTAMHPMQVRTSRRSLCSSFHDLEGSAGPRPPQSSYLYPEVVQAMLPCIFRSVSMNVDSVAVFITFQGKYAEAEPLYERCQTIYEKALGSEHPHLATALNNRAELLREKVRAVEK